MFLNFNVEKAVQLTLVEYIKVGPLPEVAESFRDVFKASGSGGLPSLKHIIGNVLIGTLSILETS